jgi:hypothetical protein
LKIPYRHLAVAGSVVALAGGGTALADPGNGNGNGHRHHHGQGPTGLSGPTGPTGPTGPKHGLHGKGHRVHKVAYIFRGTWNAADGSVTVTGGNAHVRKAGFVGQKVTFDFTNARLVVADTNNDSSKTLADVSDGDKVLVGARLPRKDPGDQPFAARKLIDLSAPPGHKQD